VASCCSAALVVVMKSVMSAYIERWNFTLGAIFVLLRRVVRRHRRHAEQAPVAPGV